MVVNKYADPNRGGAGSGGGLGGASVSGGGGGPGDIAATNSRLTALEDGVKSIKDLLLQQQQQRVISHPPPQIPAWPHPQWGPPGAPGGPYHPYSFGGMAAAGGPMAGVQQNVPAPSALPGSGAGQAAGDGDAQGRRGGSPAAILPESGIVESAPAGTVRPPGQAVCLPRTPSSSRTVAAGEAMQGGGSDSASGVRQARSDAHGSAPGVSGQTAGYEGGPGRGGAGSSEGSSEGHRSGRVAGGAAGGGKRRKIGKQTEGDKNINPPWK
ncbi:unnamed protein product [Pylaiella littoralis]